jgi:uncharacterized protein YjbI with pentapeptide repeats
MIKNDKLNLHYKDITDMIGGYFKDKIQGRDQLDNWNLDLRNQTLLHRNAAGYYEFAHKSLAEYFVAFKFAAELGCLDPVFIHTYKEANNLRCALPITKKTPTELANTFGAIPFGNPRMKVVSDLLNEIVNKEIDERLWELIYSTKNKIFEQLKFVGSNAATLLGRRDVSFEKRDLSKTILEKVDLKGCDLSEAILKDCDLNHANLFGCRFSEDSLKMAKFNFVYVTIILISEDKSDQEMHRRLSSLMQLSPRYKLHVKPLIIVKSVAEEEVAKEEQKDDIIIVNGQLDRGFNWASIRSQILKEKVFSHIGLFENEIEAISRYLNLDLYEFLIKGQLGEMMQERNSAITSSPISRP